MKGAYSWMCVRACMRVYVRMCFCMGVQVYVCACICVRACTCMHTWLYVGVCMHVHACVCMYLCLHTCAYMCACVPMCVHTCACVHMFVYACEHMRVWSMCAGAEENSGCLEGHKSQTHRPKSRPSLGWPWARSLTSLSHCLLLCQKCSHPVPPSPRGHHLDHRTQGTHERLERLPLGAVASHRAAPTPTLLPASGTPSC